MWLLILLSLFIRFFRFTKIPVSLYWDEVAIGLDARSLINSGLDINGKSWLQPLFYSYGDYKAPVYIWLTTFIGKFFSVSELTVRLPSLLASLGTAVILFFLIKTLSSKKSQLPLLVATSYIIMPWSIHFARVGFESHLSLFWLLLSAYLVIRSAKIKKPLNLIFSSLAISLGIYTYISLRIIAPLLFVSTFLIFHYKKLKQNFIYFIASLGIILLSSLILIKSPFFEDSQNYRLSNDNLVRSTTHIQLSVEDLKGWQNSLLARISHHRYIYKAKQYLTNYFTYFSPHFLALSGDPNLRHHTGFGGQLLAIQSFLLLVGVYALKKQSLKQILIILTWLGLSPVVAALVNETPHASRSIYMIIPLAWLIGLGWQWLAKNKKIHLVIIIALFINLSLFAHDYFSHYPLRSAVDWINPYKKAALAFKEKNINQPIFISNQLYRPELYFAFYLDDLSLLKPNEQFNYFSPEACPPDAVCISPPDWQVNYVQK